MNRLDYLKICNAITMLEKRMFTKRQHWHNNDSEYASMLAEYVQLSKEIIRGKEEEDGGEKFLLDDDELI
jgi:hypothetical protein